jgi:hypothetical protein
MKMWQRQLGILLFFKIAYMLLVTGVVLLFPAEKDSAMGPVEHIHWTPKGHPTFESYFTTWDAGHYLYLSEHGYHAGHEQCAFYPLWPLLIRWFSIFIGGDDIISGMVLANAFSLAGFFIFLRLVSKRFGDRIAWSSVALLLTFPGSVFFQFIYSESLFFLLVMILCFGLEQNRFNVASAAAFLLPLTRAVGIFCVLPITVHLIGQLPADFWQRAGEWIPVTRWIQRCVNTEQPGARGSTTTTQAIGPNWWLLAAPIYGWSVYFVLMWTWTGNPFEGFEAQRFWGVQSIKKLLDVPKFAVAFVSPTCWHGYIGSTLDRLNFVMLLYCLPLIWRVRRSWFAWAIVLGVVPAMSGHFTSFTRFESVVFPVPVLLAAWFNKRPSPLRFLALGMLIVLHCVLLRRFLYFEWAG